MDIEEQGLPRVGAGDIGKLERSDSDSCPRHLSRMVNDVIPQIKGA